MLKSSVFCLLIPLLQWDNTNKYQTEQNQPVVVELMNFSKEASEKVVWYCNNPNVKFIPFKHTINNRTAIIYCKVPGTYNILAYTAVNNTPTDPYIIELVVLKIDNDNPNPPIPTPPNDPLFQQLQTAYFNEIDLTKAESIKKLAAFYKNMATIINDPNIKTQRDFNMKFIEQHKILGIDGKILTIKKVLAEELNRTFPNLDVSFNKELTTSTFNKIANYLQALK